MSEPMSSVEIEDVLSSIRRLVSDDLRPLHRPTPSLAAFRPLAAERPPLTEAERPTGRLILTPALRVVRSVESPTKTVIAALEVAVEAQGEPWESENGDDAPTAPADLGWIDEVWNETAEQAIQEQQEAASAPLVLESIRTALPEDVLVESTEGNVAVIVDTDPAERPAHASWGQVADHEVDLTPGLPPEPKAEAEAPPADPVWLARAEAEVLASLADDAPEPEGPEPEPAEVFTSRRSTMPPLDDDITFDEEVLRDLVRDLIREELQGSLGERITRNVRKLVRAEIARAISAQVYE